MNPDQSEGKLNQLKGRAKKAWGELTGDQGKKAEGSSEKFDAKVQEKIGDAKDAIDRNLGDRNR